MCENVTLLCISVLWCLLKIVYFLISLISVWAFIDSLWNMIVVLRILRRENSRESVTSFNTVSLEVLKFVLFRPMQISPSSSDMKYLLLSFFTKKINKFFRKIFNHRKICWFGLKVLSVCGVLEGEANSSSTIPCKSFWDFFPIWHIFLHHKWNRTKLSSELALELQSN